MSDNAWAVWVGSTPDVDGTYRVEIHVGPDQVRFLDRAAALEYAAEVTLAGLRALHDAQVVATLRTVMADDLAASFVLDLRRDRPALRADVTAPLTLAPGVSHRDGAPFVRVSVPGADDGQWTPELCFTHAQHVLGAVAAVDLDQALLRQLRAYGIDDATARNVIGDLPNREVARKGEAMMSLVLAGGSGRDAMVGRLADAMRTAMLEAESTAAADVAALCAGVAFDVLAGD